MNYKIIENLFSYIFQLANENRLIVIILWVVIMFFLLRKLSKKDNEYYLKDFFKKNKLVFFKFKLIFIF